MIRETSKPTEWARVSEVVASAIGPNDEYPSPAQIAKHRAAQLAHDAAQPNHMQHLHIFAKGDFATFAETVSITKSFELAAGLTAHYGKCADAPIWLIDGPHCGAALFVPSISTWRTMTQPFEHDHFVVAGADVISQKINESKITDTCDLGGGIVLHVGTRDGAPIYVMRNDDPAGMCAMWHDGDRAH